MSLPRKLPGLNGLRAIAASLVVVFHVFQIGNIFGINDAAFIHNIPFSDLMSLFFVISGFVITYVLIKEKAKTGTISIKNFYIKRLLRIGPIYFLIFFLVYGICHFTSLYNWVPKLNSSSIFMVLLFFVNFNPLLNIPVSVVGHYWSLSVEEQFYLFWPFLFKKFNVLRTAVFIIILFAILRNGADYIAYHGGDTELWNKIYRVLLNLKFGSIAIGIIGALLTEYYRENIKFLFHPIIQIGCWALLILLFLNPSIRAPYIDSEVMAVIYLVLVLNVTVNPKPLISLENRFFDHLGTISYGLYMYHWPLIPIIIIGLKGTPYYNFFTSYYLLPLIAISFLITYLVALLSYKYFEAYFLRLKPKSRMRELNVRSKPILKSSI